MPSATRRSARARLTVAQAVVNYLNEIGLPCKGAARGNVPGTDQRHSMAYASAGRSRRGVSRRARRRSNWPPPARAASWPRSSAIPGPIYSVRYDKVPLAEVANSERTFPETVDRPERLRRDRRFRPLRQAAVGQRHGQSADGRRPAADDPLRADLRRAETSQVHTPSRPIKPRGCVEHVATTITAT